MKQIRCFFKRLFIIAIALISSIVANAHDFEVDGIYYNITDPANFEVQVTYKGSSYSDYDYEYSGKVVIPVIVTNGGTTYAVTSIKDYAFYECSGLTSVTIPNSVTSIGDRAFAYCSGLTSVTIGNSVTSIGEYAFRGCSGLTSVTIPNSVTSIGESAFRGCRGLTSVTIPNSVTSIGDYAFASCDGLTSVTIPNSVTSIGDYAFAYCDGLTSVTIPNSVTSIGRNAFFNCTGLKNVTIGDSVTSIGNDAFGGCSKVESLYISSAIETIGESAFAGCTSISEIQMASKKAITASYNIFSNETYNNATLYVPVGRKSDFEKAIPWKLFYIQEKDYAGIEDIIADDNSDEQIEYFNLNGVRVENPKNGIFIRRQGKKVEKVILK